MGFLMSIIIGGLAGFIAAKVMNASNTLVVNIVLGILGGVAGRFVFSLFGIGSSDGLVSSLITAVVGACVILYLYRIYKQQQQG